MIASHFWLSGPCGGAFSRHFRGRGRGHGAAVGVLRAVRSAGGGRRGLAAEPLPAASRREERAEGGGGGCKKNRGSVVAKTTFGIPCWGIGECPTHFGADFSEGREVFTGGMGF